MLLQEIKLKAVVILKLLIFPKHMLVPDILFKVLKLHCMYYTVCTYLICCRKTCFYEDQIYNVPCQVEWQESLCIGQSSCHTTHSSDLWHQVVDKESGWECNSLKMKRKTSKNEP